MKLRKLTIALVSAMIMANIASAQVPRLVNFQGFLTGPGGQPRNGTFELIFAITNAAGDQFWGETNASVDVNNGLFNVVLGNLTPFGTDVFPLDAQATNRWLGVRVAGQPLTPGQQFISMPYALLANNAFALDGITAANLSYATNALISATNELNKATNALNLATNSLQVQVKDLQDATNELNKATNALNLATNSLQVQVKDLQDATNELNKATNALNLATNSLQVQAKQLQDATNALNIATNALQVQIYSLSNTVGYVVGPAGRASYQTIQAAINAAVAAGFGQAMPVTIEVKPGAYTENLTFFAGIHLKAEIEDALFSVRVRGNHQYNYTDLNNLGDLFISGIWFDASATSGNAPIFTIGGNGFTSIRMNHCVLDSSDNQPVLRLNNTGFQGTRLSNTEMFHCRIRHLLATFTGNAVELNAGSLLLDDGEATLVNLAGRSFLAGGTSQLILDNAQIRGRIETANQAYLQLTQSAIDSGALASVVHGSSVNAIALEVLLISTLQGALVGGTGTGFFLYNNIAYLNSAAGLAQTLGPTAVPVGSTAGGDLTGLYPNPQIAAGVIMNADVNASANIAGSKVATASTTARGTVELATGTETTAGLAVQASDPRLSDARAPGGAAGGDLTGTYPNPTIANNAVTSAKINDGAVGTADIADGTIVDGDIAGSANIVGSKVRVATITTRGTVELAENNENAANLAVQANDDRLYNARPIGGTAGGDLAGTYPNPQIAAGVIMDADVNLGANIAGSKINPVFNGLAQFTRAVGTYTAPDFNVYGATRLYRANGTLLPNNINPDFQVDGVTLHEWEVGSKGGFWAAQVDGHHVGYDAFRAGAIIYNQSGAERGSMTVEGNLAVGLGGPGDNGTWSTASHGIGNIYKSGTVNFRIQHPVDTNIFLVHRGVESPVAELLYRGKAQLENGVAFVNLNAYYGLIPLTLDSIITNLSVCVYNNAGWTRVRCPAVSGVSFTIEAETTNCNDVVEWFAIGKRIGENVSDDIELDE